VRVYETSGWRNGLWVKESNRHSSGDVTDRWQSAKS